jgi:hypothetical protein
MKKLLLLIVFAVFTANAQSSLWKETSNDRIDNLVKMERDSYPLDYKLFQMDLNAMKNTLHSAPNRDNSSISNTIIEFPSLNGEMEHFKIFEANIMHPDLALKFPEIKNYVGIGIDDPTASIRITTSIFGFHGMILSGKHKTIYIDTYTKDLNNYIVYNKSSLRSSVERTCLVENQDQDFVANSGKFLASPQANDGIFRTYRLAMACTIEYAAFHVNAAGLSTGTLAQKKAAVLSAMVVTVNRVDGVYERDLAVTMQLVPNNDILIFIDSDNFSNDNANALIGESQSVINAAIQSVNYDLGHTVSTGGGGLAGLGVVCVNGSKARGITGSPSPVGDPYDIDYVAHEIGHQFGCNHTFTGNTGSCSGNANNNTAVEPGSGSTIMAYAGICTGQDVQGNSDDYFHAVSLAEAFNHITGVGNCATNLANGNNPPVIAASTNYTIPKGTPFKLTAPTTTDANGDTVTYCWEQLKNSIGAITNVPSATSTSGINFRSYDPTTLPYRYFPKMTDILAGNLAPTWEVLPNVARSMTFALTARDNRSPNGGQTAVQNTTITVDGTRGPLLVTSQNTANIVWTPGTTENIIWSVNSTNASAGGATVDILLSTDGGLTYPTVLLANTANDGSETITVPNVSAPNCRVMVKASGNIFFNVNLKNIAIGNYTYQTQNICTDYTFNLNATMNESSDTSYPGITLNIPDSYTITDTNFYANVTHPSIGQFSLLIRAPWQTALNTAIWYNNTTCTSANMDKWFDTAGTAVNCAATTTGGPFLPFSVTNINGYNGNNSAGSWIVYFKDTVVDGNAANATFNTFKIQLCKSESVAVLTTQSFELDNLTIYPNPNNGSFSVQFDATSDKTNIVVHDIRGRVIFENEFQSSGLFNETLQLKNIQSGIYLVTVQNGAKKSVKKIIVE